MTIIIGIDPGSRITGYGIICKQRSTITHIAHGQIHTQKELLADKLNELFAGLQTVLNTYQPQEAAVEQVFTCYNHQSALKLGQARGAALVALAHAGLTVSEYSAKQVKRAVVGYGNAEKTQIQHMIRALLKLTTTPLADAADALAIALCHAHSHSLKNKIAQELAYD